MIRRGYPKPSAPIMKYGIVYYVYTSQRCQEYPRYILEVAENSAYVKSMDPSAKIALVTNCDVDLSTARLVDIIQPIHERDLVKASGKQFVTRMLYNAYLPFEYSFITDTHVYPCDKKSYADILSNFRQSNIDISYSARVNGYPYAFGAAALSKWGNGSFGFWVRVHKEQVKLHNYDDQGPMTGIMRKFRNKLFTFKWLSSNYIYAAHGINNLGRFSGPGKCFRSSIVVTGPIRWVHGSLEECEIMNGKNREYIEMPRVWFSSGTCNTTFRGRTVFYREEDYKKAIYPCKVPSQDWKPDFKKKPSYGLFWNRSIVTLNHITITRKICYFFTARIA